MNLRFNIHAYSSTEAVKIWPGSKAEKFYLKFKESGSDEDFETFVEWMREDIADAIDFEVEGVEECH